MVVVRGMSLFFAFIFDLFPCQVFCLALGRVYAWGPLRFDCFLCLWWKDSAFLSIETVAGPWKILQTCSSWISMQSQQWVPEIAKGQGASVALPGHGTIIFKKVKTTYLRVSQ